MREKRIAELRLQHRGLKSLGTTSERESEFRMALTVPLSCRLLMYDLYNIRSLEIFNRPSCFWSGKSFVAGMTRERG